MEILNENSTFSEWGERWKKRNIIGLAYGRQITIESQLAHIYSFIGNLPINKIKLMNLDDIIIERGNLNPNTGKPMSKAYLKEIRNVVKSIFNYAIMNCDGYIKNPAMEIKIPKNAPKTTVRALNEQEQKWIYDMPHRLRCGCLLMMFCGLRAGELIALKWSDIDFKNKLVNINKNAIKTAPNKFEIKQSTKNGKSRTVSIPDLILNDLNTYYQTSSSLIVCPKRDGTMQSPSSWRSLWNSYIFDLNRIFGNSKLDTKYTPKKTPQIIEKIRPHMLRHTYATMLYNSGVDIMTASKLMGHADIQTTLKIYTELREQTMIYSINKFDNYVSGRRGRWFESSHLDFFRPIL